MNETSGRVRNAVTIVKCLIAYRLGEKLLGRRPENDYSIDLRPIYAAADFTKEEHEAFITELSRLTADAEGLKEPRIDV
jgi:hypothetical protein